MTKHEKRGLHKALDILSNMTRYNLCWVQLDESPTGDYIEYRELKEAIIKALQGEHEMDKENIEQLETTEQAEQEKLDNSPAVHPVFECILDVMRPRNGR